MQEVIQIQPELPSCLRAHDFSELINESRLTECRQAHDFSFIAVVREAEKLCRRGIKNSERVWILDLTQHLDRLPFADGPHGRDKITKTIERQKRRAFKRRDKECARQM